MAECSLLGVGDIITQRSVCREVEFGCWGKGAKAGAWQAGLFQLKTLLTTVSAQTFAKNR